MRDARVEQWLEHQAVDWDYVEELAWEAVEVNSNISQQIRLTAKVNDDKVMQYGLAMERGDKFPAVIVIGANGGPYHLAGGIHRRGAALLTGHKMTDAYVIHVTDPLVISRLRRSSNVYEGWGNDLSERLAQAKALVAEGYSRRQAAEQMGVRADQLEVSLRVDDTRAALTADGLDGRALGRLKDQHLKELHTIQRPKIRTAVAGLMPYLATDERHTLMAKVRSATSDDDALQHIASLSALADTRRARSSAGQYRPPSTFAQRLIRQLSVLSTLSEHRLDISGMSEAERERIGALAGEVSTWLVKVRRSVG